MCKVLTFGVYDFFHLGHLRLFKQAREYGDYLIVAVQDGDFLCKFKPDTQIFYTTKERVEIIKELRIVDEVIVYQVLGTEILAQIDFDVLALGEDHRGGRFDVAAEWCKLHDKDVVRLKRTPNISSSNIKKLLNNIPCVDKKDSASELR